MAKLTNKQEQFCQEYIIDLNATQAAIRAGYSEKTACKIGSENLTKPDIQCRLSELQEARAKRVQVDQDYVLSTILETINRCAQHSPVVNAQGEQQYTETPDGEVVPAYKFDANSVLKGSELLGKHLKMFTDKVDNTHSGPDGQPIKTESTFNFIPVGSSH